jgi:hypothetical protein
LLLRRGSDRPPLGGAFRAAQQDKVHEKLNLRRFSRPKGSSDLCGLATGENAKGIASCRIRKGAILRAAPPIAVLTTSSPRQEFRSARTVTRKSFPIAPARSAENTRAARFWKPRKPQSKGSFAEQRICNHAKVEDGVVLNGPVRISGILQQKSIDS